MLRSLWITASLEVAALTLIVFPSTLGIGREDGTWYVAALKLSRVHQIADGSGVTVAVIDSGIDWKHPAVAGKVLPGADFSDDEDNSTGEGRTDLSGHGTGMASLIVGSGAVQGVAPAARVIPIRVAEGRHAASEISATAVASGIRWAVDHGANVINVSLGSPISDPREASALQYALERGVVVVAAAGNTDQGDRVQYPASQEGVIAVCSTNSKNEHSPISVTGPELTVCAPGEGVLRASRNSNTVIGTGTSDSAAIVSGVAALILQRDLGLRPHDIARRLILTADDVGAPGRDALYGFGIVNPLRAVTAQLSAVSATSEASAGVKLPNGDRSSHSWYILAAAGTAIALGVMIIAARRRRIDD